MNFYKQDINQNKNMPSMEDFDEAAELARVDILVPRTVKINKQVIDTIDEIVSNSENATFNTVLNILLMEGLSKGNLELIK